LVKAAGGHEEVLVHNHHVGAAMRDVLFNESKCRFDAGKKSVLFDLCK
jgi:hypothetical protein